MNIKNRQPARLRDEGVTISVPSEGDPFLTKPDGTTISILEGALGEHTHVEADLPLDVVYTDTLAASIADHEATDDHLGQTEIDDAIAAHVIAEPHGGEGGAHPDLATHDSLGLATDAELTAHAADTTSVHGISDTSVLETTSGSQAKVDTHVNDTTDAHDASAISIADAGNDFTATDVEGALAELQADNEAHVAASDPHTGYVREADANYVDLTDGGETALHTHAGGVGHPDLATHDALGLATDTELAAHEAEQHGVAELVIAASNSTAADKAAADYLCDGTADEVQFQAAMDALTMGGVVRAAPGTYNFAAGVLQTANVRIVLQLDGSLINLASGVTGFKVAQGCTAGIRGVHFRGARIDGTGAGGTNVGIELEDTNNSTVVGAYITDCATAILFESNATDAFVEGTLLDDVLIRDCGTGVKFVTVSGTGSWMQTVIRHLKVAATTIGFDMQTGGQLMRSHVQGTVWISTNQTGWRLDGVLEDTHLYMAVEGEGGSTGNTAIYVGSNASQTEQAFLHGLFTGTIATQIDNAGNKDFIIAVSGTTTSFSTGTARISYRRHGDSTDRIRLTAPTAGGKIELGDGTTLDVNAYRSAANVLSSDDKIDPASLNLQVKAGTPVDGDVTGGAANGDVIWDSTGNYLWVRENGSWQKAAAQDIADHEAASDPHTGYVREADANYVDLTDGGATTLHSHAGGGGGAPTDADYLVGTANGTLSNEIVVGTTPGGELGGTWDSPTVDATHSGSAHHTQSHDHSAAGDGQSLNPAGTVRLGSPDTITTTGAITAQAVTASVLRWNGGGSATIHGIAGGAEGRIILIENVTTGQNLTLAHQSATETTATNRIIGADAGDYAIRPGVSLVLSYDNTTQRWRILMPGASASTPVAVDATAGSAGTQGANFSRSDHRHQGHAQSHAITSGSDHSHSGGTAGRFFRETGATSFAFEAIAVSKGGTLLNPAGGENIIVWRAPFACTVTNVRGYRVGGSGATINARRNGSSNHLSSALSVTSADTWMDGGSVQNTAYAAGDKLEIMVVTASGSPTQVAVQVDFTRP